MCTFKKLSVAVAVILSVFMMQAGASVVMLEDMQIVMGPVQFDADICEAGGMLLEAAPVVDWVLFHAAEGSRVELADADIISDQDVYLFNVSPTISYIGQNWNDGEQVAEGLDSTYGALCPLDALPSFAFSWTVPGTVDDTVYLYFIGRISSGGVNLTDIDITVGEEPAETFQDVFFSVDFQLFTFSITGAEEGDLVTVNMSEESGAYIVPVGAVICADIPEPATICLLAGCGLAALLRRKR